MLDNTDLNIVVDKFNTWDDNSPETNKKQSLVWYNSKNEKVDYVR